MSSVLIVDDEPHVLTTLSRLLNKDYEVVTATSAEAAQEIFAQRTIDIVLADQRLPGMTGVQLLDWVRQRSPKTIRMMMTGLAKLEDLVEAINCGQVYRFLLKPWRAEHLLQNVREASRTFMLERNNESLLEELRQLNAELEERVRQRTQELEGANRQLEEKNEMLKELALTDSLTNLPNRRAMDRLAKSELRRRERYPGPLALGILDIDHFKEVNARYLLTGGDAVLQGLSSTLRASVREVDHVGRVGGEEFMVVAPQTNLEGAIILGERIRSAVENCGYRYEESTIKITVSVGITVAEAGVSVGYESLRRVAAAAMQEAKQTGRNRSVVRAVPAGEHEENLEDSPTPF